MNGKQMWVVRAASGGRNFDEFRTRSFVAIGWQAMGDMSDLKTREDFTRRVTERFPDSRKAQTAVSAGQAFRFVREIKVGDRIVTYGPEERIYLVGTITGEYEYSPSSFADAPNLHRVSWEGKVSRDLLSVSTRNSLGAISTLFQVPSDAAEEIERLLRSGAITTAPAPVQDEATEVDALLKDVQAKAFEFIKDKVSRLDWEEMQELVAGVLRAMGYKTRISPSGSDRGKDIVASPDGFGFESPRIVVEVKHRSGTAMGSQDVRSFLGGRHKDDKGLYVSTGGFSREARYEADRASIPVTLMDLDDLVKALLEHYEKIDVDTQRLIPLRKVYWPV
jgi:restriction system protein